MSISLRQKDDRTVHREVIAANAAHAERFGAKGRLPLPPARRFAMLTCMDMRTPVKDAGSSEGQANMVYNASGDATRSLIVPHRLPGTQVQNKNMIHFSKLFGTLLLCALLVSCGRICAQQIPDSAFLPAVAHPLHPKGKGPLVRIDAAHHNFHTLQGRYAAFARILEADGYRVDENNTVFSSTALAGVTILVIANALNEHNLDNWTLPTPSAFTRQEIQAVKEWVYGGGSLFLIADHMPMAGAASDLANGFGVRFNNGFATDTSGGMYPGQKKELDIFRRSDGTLGQHEVTAGIDSVATFTGQGFQLPQTGLSLLTFPDHYVVLLPDTAWRFSAHTKRIPAKGISQGGVLPFGAGRVAVFGEAAMFTAQRKGPEKFPFGLNAPDATQNTAFLLQLVHWLEHRSN